jgi:hypothetical protein
LNAQITRGGRESFSLSDVNGEQSNLTEDVGRKACLEVAKRKTET